jgi:phosphoenolpyruvate-protein phosphotransferase
MTGLSNDLVLLAPFTGPMVPLAAVPDAVFSSAMLGDGIGIDPLQGQLLAPCDGTISHLARTAHALTLTSREGAQILLHIGIDTVELKGQGFTAKVQLGDQVKTGDVLIAFDLDYVATHARSLVSVIALVNGDAFTIVERAGSGMLTAGLSPLLSVRATGTAAAPVATAAGAASYRATVVLSHPGGLHARPAARAREAIRGLSAHVEVRYEGRRASMDSVVSLLGLGAGEGAALEVVAQGDDAQAALDAVVMELQRAAPAEIETGAPDAAARPIVSPRAGAAPAMQAHTLNGVCAGPGIGVGRLVHWGRDDLTAPEQANGAPAQESALLDQALARVDADLLRTVEAATQRGASGEAGIFTVHRLMLEDPVLLDAARDLIRHGKSGGYAWRESIRAQAAVLAGVGDALLAERSSDLRDLEGRVLRALGYAGSSAPRAALPEQAVLAADEFTPADFAELDRTRVMALVMARGGATSHAAIIARQWGIPALVAVGDALLALPEGSPVIVDASQGTLAYAPDAAALDAARAQRRRLDELRAFNRQSAQSTAVTQDGRTIEVAANIATLADAGTAVENGADAVGLLRTELLFIHRRVAPSVAQHTQSYQGIVDALAGRTAIIRTLDVGGDKEVEYLTLPPEPNPALGLRGIRLAQVHPELLDDQLRGLLAVQPYGRVRILLPMVTDVGELIRLRARIDALARDAGRSAAIEVGIMIEVPSAALLADQLAQHADFLSIGTNDLTQYTLAIDRCQPELAARADGLHPAVLRLIAMTAAGAAKHGKWLGVCGALAGDPLAVPLLIGLGVTELSVDPVSVPGIKARIRTLDYQLCRQRAQDILALESPQAVRAASRETWPLDG